MDVARRLTGADDAWRTRVSPTLFVNAGDTIAEIRQQSVTPPHVASIMRLCVGAMAVVWTHVHDTRHRVETFHSCGRQQSSVDFRRTAEGWIVLSHRAAAPLVLTPPPGFERPTAPPTPPTPRAVLAPRPKRILEITAPPRGAAPIGPRVAPSVSSSPMPARGSD